MVVTMRDFTPWGYSYESAWGTDPATSRLPFLGDVARMTVALDEQKEVRRSVGSGIDPKGFCRKARKIDANLVMNLADDNPDNSFLALALGSAPNASGVVTNYPSGSNRNLRSVSIEGGFDAAFDEFYLLKGCMVQSLDLIFEEGFVREEVKFVCKDLVRSSSRAVVAPTESTTSLFNPHDDVTMTWNGTPIPVVYEQRMKLSIQNKLSAKHICRGPGRNLGYSQLVGRDVTLEVTTPREDDAFVDLYEADPSTSSAELTSIVLNLSKNGGSQYINLTLSNAQVIAPIEFDAESGDNEVVNTWIFQPKTYALDVKA